MDSKKCIICGNEIEAEDEEDTCSKECAIAASFWFYNTIMSDKLDPIYLKVI